MERTFRHVANPGKGSTGWLMKKSKVRVPKSSRQVVVYPVGISTRKNAKSVYAVRPNDDAGKLVGFVGKTWPTAFKAKQAAKAGGFTNIVMPAKKVKGVK